MQIKDVKLLDLYQRFCNSIVSDYPKAILSEGKNYLTISFPGEMARIFVFQDEPLNSLILRISTDITSKLTKDNSILFYVASLDELNKAKIAAYVILAQKLPQTESKAAKDKVDKATSEQQGYLLDYNRKQIGVVQLNLIPTNAYVTFADEANNKTPVITEEEIKEEQLKRAKRGTIAKFFRR